MIRVFVLLLGFGVPLSHAMTNATYNSFRQQIGYCKMQSFETVSRSTSGSVPMFMDGRIRFGVGLSDFNMRASDAELCGMCLRVTSVDNFFEWNEDLTEWLGPIQQPVDFLVMVFDRCPDEICIQDFLDFDIYSPLQPVARGNPTHLSWTQVPCPVAPHEKIEYLICTSYSCNQQNPAQQTTLELLNKTHYYWTITFRNIRVPIGSATVHYEGRDYPLRKENSWTWDGELYNLWKGINITFVSVENKVLRDFIQMDSFRVPKSEYHGGILVQSELQT